MAVNKSFGMRDYLQVEGVKKDMRNDMREYYRATGWKGYPTRCRTAFRYIYRGFESDDVLFYDLVFK